MSMQIIRTVGELVAALQHHPEDMRVILSRDAEGNRFNDLAGIEVAAMQADDADLEPIHPDDLPDYDGEELDRAVYLWPV